MTRWKKFLVAASTGATLVVMATVAASASTTGRDALRAAGGRAVLMASTSTGTAQPGAAVASGTGLGPIEITIGSTWNLQGRTIVNGTVTVTCGPFLISEGGSAGVTIEEQLGDKIGHAQGEIQQLTCDGAAHSYPVSALVTDVPFRRGSGAVSVTASAFGETTSGFFTDQNGSAITTVTFK